MAAAQMKVHNDQGGGCADNGVLVSVAILCQLIDSMLENVPSNPQQM
jgi:hypothetical protein